MNTEKELTGYPSIDKPWLKYYSEEAINASLPRKSMYQFIYDSNKDRLDNIIIAATAFAASGVKKGTTHTEVFNM